MKNTAYKTETKDVLTKYVISIIIAAVLLAAASIFGANSTGTIIIVLYVFSVAAALCISTLHSIEAVMDKRFEAVLLRNIAVLVVFFCGAYSMAALVAIIFCFSDMILHFSNITASKAYIKNQGAEICYSVADGDEVKSVSADKLQAGDKVIVNDGDYLCFDGACDNGKKQYCGIYKGERQTITVSAVYDYSVDFSAELSDTAPIYRYIRMIYPFAVLLIAVIFAAVKLLFAHTSIIGSIFAPAVVLLLCMPDMILSGIAAYYTKADNSAKLLGLQTAQNIVVNMTGVLTKGELTVGDIVCKKGYEDKDIISMCAAVQPNFDNRYAKAFLSYLGVGRVNTVPSEYLPHLGVKADISGRTVLVGSEKLMNDNGIDCAEFEKYTVFVAVDSTLIAAVKMNDTLLANACKAMHELKAAGHNTYVVTANNSLTAQAVANNCGAEYKALCDDKAAYINTLKKSGKTAYIGDDEAAAAAADVAIGIDGNETLASLLDGMKSAGDIAAHTKIRMAAGFVVSATIITLIILNVLHSSLLWLIAIIIAALICLPEYVAAKQLDK